MMLMKMAPTTADLEAMVLVAVVLGAVVLGAVVIIVTTPLMMNYIQVTYMAYMAMNLLMSQKKLFYVTIV